MQNKYYIVMEIVTDADGLVSSKVIKTTEVMPIVPEEEEEEEEPE